MQRVETEAVVKTWKELVRSVDVRNVIDVLIEEGMISFEDSDYITKGQTTCEQSRRMLLKVIDCSDPATFAIFMRALQENYPFLVEEVHRKLSSLKRQRFKKAKQKHAVDVEHVEVEYDLNITELNRRVQPIQNGCSICRNVDGGCSCNRDCTAGNSDVSSHPPFEHSSSWSPSGSFDVGHAPARRQRLSLIPPQTMLDQTNAARAAFGSFDISRYERISLIPSEYLQQLADELDGASGGLDPTEILRQLSLNTDKSTPPRSPQEHGITPDASIDIQSNHVTADRTLGIQAPHSTASQPELTLSTSVNTRVKRPASNCSSVSRPPSFPTDTRRLLRRPETPASTVGETEDTSGETHVKQVEPNGIMGPVRRREPTEGSDGEIDNTDLKQVVTNGVRDRDVTPGGTTAAQEHQAPVNGVTSRESTRFMGPPKHIKSKNAAPPSHSNGTNGATRRVCHTCRRHVLITPRVVKKNKDYGFRLGDSLSSGGFSVEHIANGGPAANRLLPTDIIFSINTEEVKGWNKRKANKKIEATHRQLVLEVESKGEILEHRIGLTLSRSDPKESWGFSMIHGSLRPRFPGDIEFYCTDVDTDSPIGRSGLLRAGDVLTGCVHQGKHISLAGKSQEEVNALIISMENLSLHIARKEFIREDDPRYGLSSC